MQTTGLAPVHTPVWHVSVWVQALPSLHVLPFVALGLLHTPLVVLQTPTAWHWSKAVHTTRLPPVQVPLWQVSVWLHALPSLHAVPSTLDAGVEQTPLVVSQVPAMWH